MSYKLINKGRTPCGTYWTIEVNRELYRASAITAPVTGPEVLIFPADANHEVSDWIEVYGRRGTLDHEAVIQEWISEGAS